MTKTITRDDVLRYIFRETSKEENLAIENELLKNVTLMDYYKQSVESIQEVVQLELEPTEKAVSKILNYSESMKAISIS
jgi:hypothetical protein